ncbi:MAG: tripartite tricarboxylate transporter substrate binding protein [Burkholderiales bacterium]|nr:tripartite tricarboxylate transporter substrate binding protein [Burkholderiales bacterium]
MKAARFVAGAVVAAMVSAAHAQKEATDYPSRPIRLIVPFSPGGVGDTLLRPIAVKLTERWKQQIVFDHRPGANTIIGTELGAKANPDGYTLLFASAGSMSINPHVYGRLPYDAARDFVPVAPITAYSYVVAAHPSLAANAPAELIALARSKPGTLAFASTGNGSAGHLAGAMFELLAGVKLLHVAFKGSAPATLELLAGRVLLNFTGMALVAPQMKNGKLKVIGVCSEKRLAMFPDIPAFGEVGLKGYEGGTWFGIVAPAATPAPVVAALNAAISAAVLAPDVKERQTSLGLDVYTDTPRGFDKFIQTERARIGAVVKAFNIRVD